MSDEKIDLGSFGELVDTSEAIPRGEVWVGPRHSDPFAAFGPGTTKGGRAEAGWCELGNLEKHLEKPCECDCFECRIKRHDICRYQIKCVRRPWTKEQK